MLLFLIVHFDLLETFRFDIETFQDRNFVFDFVSISLTLLIATASKRNESVAVSPPSLSMYSNTRFLCGDRFRVAVRLYSSAMIVVMYSVQSQL